MLLVLGLVTGTCFGCLVGAVFCSKPYRTGFDDGYAQAHIEAAMENRAMERDSYEQARAEEWSA